MQIENKEEREFILRNYETDFCRRIKPSAILGFFQETAGDHSEKMGLGYGDLAKQDCFWVLSKIYVEIDRRPVCREKIRVITWPHAPNKAIYERSFVLEDEKGAAMRAYSRWCILKKSGRIVPASGIRQPELEYIAERSVSFDNWLISSVEDRSKAAYSLRVANSEYDFNRHVNNIRYADYIFNCFSVSELEEKSLRSFQLHYVRQSYEGDALDFYRHDVTEKECLIEGVRNGGETVVAAKVSFD